MSDRLKDCQFLLETGASHTLTDRLEHRALDIIVAAYLDDIPDWAESNPILTDGFVGIAPKGMLDLSAPDIREQLHAHPLIQYSKRHFMGRQVDDHLSANKFRLTHRFELDSYHAVLALVAQGTGWTILTPLALQRARRFSPDLDVFPLPFKPLNRTITLAARKDILGDMPAEIASHLKDLLQEVVLNPMLADHPWMSDVIKLR